MAKKTYATLNDCYHPREVRVEVMAIVGNYAMVRVPRCMPFVAETKSLVMEKGETP